MFLPPRVRSTRPISRHAQQPAATNPPQRTHRNERAGAKVWERGGEFAFLQEKVQDKERKTYIAIDLKSFYASVECVARGLDPLTTNLVVADMSRTEKTICLAVSPSLKSYGIGGRARLFEVVQKVREINAQRRWACRSELKKGVYDNNEIQGNPALALDYIVAPPRMAEYMKVSSRVYETYLEFISAEDIHVYSIDEVFMDVSDYLQSYEIGRAHV